MTHTLHRSGCRADLEDDFVVFAIAAQTVNARGAGEKFKRFGEIAAKYEPVSFGDMNTGNSFAVPVERIMEGMRGNSIVHAVFTSAEKVTEVLRELARDPLGPSIVVSGLMKEVAECCHRAETKPHTVEHSLGVWGRTDVLPEKRILNVSTMCGHGMVSFNLVRHLAQSVKEGLPPEDAAREMAKQCHCGVFNPVRAARILRDLAGDI